MMIFVYLFFGIVIIGVGFVIGVIFHKGRLQRTFDEAQGSSETIISEAQSERDSIINQAHFEAKQITKRLKQNAEQEFAKRKSEVNKFELKVKKREDSLEKKLNIIEKKETDLEKMADHLVQEERKFKSLINECELSLEDNRKTLESIASLSQEDAKRELIRSLESEARKEALETIKKIEIDAEKKANQTARSMISLAVQRVSSEYVNDSTVTVVSLPDDEMKGRIIGREGRNIRSIEQSTGVDLIIDDTPEAVILSCFNPLRREIARIALERLIADGRIHPARIEETVKKVRTDFDNNLLEFGEQAAFDIGVTDLHPNLLKHLGKLKFKTTGQQTILQHSIEVAKICAIMAGEMGIDIKKAKRCGLLHDIGKALDQEAEGHHSEIGAKFLSKQKENDEIIEAVKNHHAEDLTLVSPLTVILHGANLLSSSRPGARKEVLESYVKRLSDMEALVTSFEGIEDAYVIQAGREIRALVKLNMILDNDVRNLTQEVAAALRKELTFPGQVKVTLLRETSMVDFAT